jgi:hypothetical protein
LRENFSTPIYGFCDAINAIGYAIHRSRSHNAVANSATTPDTSAASTVTASYSLAAPDSIKDHRGFDLISDVLPFGRLVYGGANASSNAVSYAQHYSCSHDAVIRVYDAAAR